MHNERSHGSLAEEIAEALMRPYIGSPYDRVSLEHKKTKTKKVKKKTTYDQYGPEGEAPPVESIE